MRLLECVLPQTSEPIDTNKLNYNYLVQGEHVLVLSEIVVSTLALGHSAGFSVCEGCTSYKQNGECLHMALLKKIAQPPTLVGPALLWWVDQGNRVSKTEDRVVRLYSAKQTTQRYAVCLTTAEAEFHDCHVAAVCLVTKGRGNSIDVKCTSGLCLKSKLNKNSKPCGHCKLLVKYVVKHNVFENQSVVNENAGSDDEDSNEESSDLESFGVDDDVSSRVVSEGICFDPTQNHWVSAKDCSHSPIPLWTELTVDQRLVIFDRQTLSCVSRDPNTGRPIIDSNGCFQGYPCVPSECEKCRTTLRDSAPANFLGQIHIMVQQGIITRPRFDLLCPACNHVNSWDPATELIHTIRNGAYGGNS